jgi:hypothetical protein
MSADVLVGIVLCAGAGLALVGTLALLGQAVGGPANPSSTTRGEQ